MTQPGAAYTACVGDRLPDVRLLAPHGESVRLHARFAGKPLWLALAGGPGCEALPVPGGDDVDALVVAPSMPAPHGAWQAYSADPRWCALLPAGVVLQLDANLRVMALHDARHPLRVAASTPAPLPSAEQTAMCAPVLQIPDVLDRALCRRLIDHLLGPGEGGDPSMVLVLEQGAATPRLDAAVKMRRETFVRDAALEREVDAMLARRAVPEIARVFHFRVSRRDPLKLLAYPAGAGYFRAHRDNDTHDVAYRRFAVSINLNTGEYGGGEFRFPEFGGSPYAMRTGAALVFSCSLLHEVTPVDRGIRYALTTFFA
ncbi:2OG-Fe(II) oxygenase family protein [Cognatilysobacter lacus]|uniref:2OG-Fe(II) oxygenase n=1 Tax=Cognatilysobacter lacus TaxID=1643323 RepID=A0A5D8Z9H1_9GAMM|nr:2OG-Fe(II) oxygenase [Lysobacter lacus]TZF91216.1 2OG-Fe(II) oxygenase [Lysobacter lacus]